MFDVLIIGGGCTGSLTARLLSHYQLKVALLEKGADVAWGASRANSAISHAGYDCENGTLKAKLNVRGTELMEGLCRELGVMYKRTGSHVIAFSEEDLAHIQMLYQRGVNNGVPGLRLISGEELRKMEPNVSEAAVGSLFAPTAGLVCTYGLTIGAAENAALNGTEIHLNAKVKALSYTKGVWTVKTEDATYETRYLVNAAGVCAPEIAALMGDTDFPIVSKPSRGQYLVLDKQYGTMAHSTLFVTPSAKGKGILVSPTPDGNLIVGPNAEPVPGDESTETTPEGLAEITAGGLRIMPKLPLKSVIKSFSGVRPNANQYDFYVQPSGKVPQVVHAAAMSSPGLASSPATAEYIVSLLQGLGLKLEEKTHYYTGRRSWGNPKRFIEMTPEEQTDALRRDPSYGRVICRCETVTEGDIREALQSPLPPTSIDMIKHRLRAGMGRCQGGFCSPRVAELLAEAQGVTLDRITQCGGDSYLVLPREENSND